MSAAAARALPDTVPTEVADGIWAYAQWDGSWWINTTGFVARGAILAVDACATEGRTRSFRHAIESITGRPAGLLVNTHAHGDHTFGNAIFQDAVIVASEGCRRSILAFTAAVPDIRTFTMDGYDRIPEWGNIERIRPPDLTFETRLSLWLDDIEADLIHFDAPAHTDHDAVVWLPQQRVLFAGDLIFNGGVPLAVAGSVAGAIQVLTKLAELQPDVIVPGHGQPCSADAIDFHLRYWRMVQNAARSGLNAGMSPIQVAHELDQGEFAELTDPERIVLNLHSAYHDLDTGHVYNMPCAVADAVSYVGRPIRCIA